jgi:hypothetical protein
MPRVVVGRDTRLDVFIHFSRVDELRSGATALEQQSLALLQEQSRSLMSVKTAKRTSSTSIWSL